MQIAFLFRQWLRKARLMRPGRFCDSSDRENSYCSAFLGGVYYRGGAINFYQRLARKRGDGYTGAGRATVWKVSLEDFIQAIVVVEFGKEDGKLQNTVHGAAAGFNEGLNVFHHHTRMHLDVGCFAGIRIIAAGMRALTGNINDAVVDDQRSDEAGVFGWLAFVIEF